MFVLRHPNRSASLYFRLKLLKFGEKYQKALAYQGSTGGFLLLQYCDGVWQHLDLQVSQHVVSVESSSLLHCRIYLWFRTEQIYVSTTMAAEGKSWDPVKL